MVVAAVGAAETPPPAGVEDSGCAEGVGGEWWLVTLGLVPFLGGCAEELGGGAGAGESTGKRGWWRMRRWRAADEVDWSMMRAAT